MHIGPFNLYLLHAMNEYDVTFDPGKKITLRAVNLHFYISPFNVTVTRNYLMPGLLFSTIYNHKKRTGRKAIGRSLH